MRGEHLSVGELHFYGFMALGLKKPAAAAAVADPLPLPSLLLTDYCLSIDLSWRVCLGYVLLAGIRFCLEDHSVLLGLCRHVC